MRTIPVGFVLALAAIALLALPANVRPDLRGPGVANAGTSLPGDANCDGTVNAIDATLVLQYSAELLGVLPCPENGNVNGRGNTNALDAALILQFVAGLLTTIGTPPPTNTPTAVPSITPTATSTPTASPTETATAAATPTETATATTTATSTPALTPTPSASPGPTKQPEPGDTDGDGCSDKRENGPDETLGGQRDYLNPWDFYDVAIAGEAPGQDGQIDLLNDIVGVLAHFAPTGTEPEYDVNFDRGPSVGPNQWNMTAPDGKIDLFNDLVGVVSQAFHDCR